MTEQNTRRRTISTVCVVFLSLAPPTLLAQSEIQVDGRTYISQRPARHNTYDWIVPLAVRDGKEAFDRVDLLFGMVSDEVYGRFEWDASGHRLSAVSAEGTTLLSQAGDPLPDSLRRGGTLIVKRRTPWLDIVADGRRLTRVLCDGIAQGDMAVGTGTEHPVVERSRYQRVEPFVFADDFMRTEEEAETFTQWRPQSGAWRIYSVMDQVRDNPDARIREGRELVVGRIVNPFSLSGRTADKPAEILAGHTFQDDYSIAVSTKTSGGVTGVVFGAREDGSSWIVRWTVLSRGIEPSPIELVHRTEDRTRVVATGSVPARTDNWYRIEARAVGSTINVAVDGATVLTARDDRCVGGQYGLFADSKGETFFDDVEVRSVPELRLDDADLVRRCTMPVSGDWDLQTAATGLVFSAASSGEPSVCLVGFPSWQPRSLEATVRAESGAREFGLAFGIDRQPPEWRFTWTDADGGRLVLRTDTSVGTESPFHLDLAVPHCFRIETELGVLKCYVDDVLQLRHRTNAEIAGRIGFVACGRGRTGFRDVVLDAPSHQEWEHPVKIAAFAGDPFMQGWASPRRAWMPTDDMEALVEGATVYENKSDFYGAFHISVPLSRDLALLFGQDKLHPTNGYRVQTRLGDDATAAITITRRGETVAEASFTPGKREVIEGEPIVDEKLGELPSPPDTVSYGTLMVSREGHYMWVTLDGKELVSYRDPTPLTGRAVGLEVNESLDLGLVDVRRDHTKDYHFERVSVDWTKIGTWEVTNRFACDPRWSHMNGKSRGVAAYWNKFEYEGDFTVECFAGMRMRQGEMREGKTTNYYPRTGDINFALCADGRDLFSGYNVIFSAWDESWSEHWTQFWRLGDVVEQTDREFIPRTRNGKPRERAVEVEWDPGGRAVHGAWYFVKIRKTGDHFDVWFDDVPVFSFTDPDGLTGRRLALWTQDNSIVVARAKFGYRNPPRIPPADDGLHQARRAGSHTETPEPPQFLSPTHPGLYSDFENGLGGWRSADDDQGAEARVVERDDDQGGHALELTNVYGGGDFETVIPLPLMDAGRIGRLEFDCAIPAGVYVNLCLKLRDRPYERCFVTLSGPDQEQGRLLRVGRFEGFESDGNWHRVRVDLAAALRQRFPGRDVFELDEIGLACFHEGYLNAGLGGNATGASYLIDNVVVAATGPRHASFAWNGAEDATCTYTVSKDPAGDQKEVVSEATTFAVDLPGVGLWYVRSTVSGVDSGTTYPVWVDAPPRVIKTSPADGAKWGGSPVELTFDDTATAHPLLAGLSLQVNGVELCCGDSRIDYDPVARRLRITPAVNAGFADQSPLNLTLYYRHSAAGHMAVATPPLTEATDDGGTGDGDALNDEPTETAAQAEQDHRYSPAESDVLSYEWTARMSHRRDKTPPAAVRLDSANYVDVRPGLSSTSVSAGSVPEYLALERVARDGGDALRVANRVCGSDSSIELDVSGNRPYAAAQLEFDYCLSPHARPDVRLRSRGGTFIIGFADSVEGRERVVDGRKTRHSKYGRVLGDIGDVVADGTWHHAEFDLLKALSFGSERRAAGNATDIVEIAFGDWGYAAAPPGAWYAIDNVRLAPITQTSEGLTLNWSSTDISGIDAYSFVWDTELDTQPDTNPETSDSSAVFTEVPGGRAVFHIRARDGAGNWSPTSHFPFRIDNEPPRIEIVTPKPGSADAPEAIVFDVADAETVADTRHMQLKINDATVPRSTLTVNEEEGRVSWLWSSIQRRTGSEVTDGREMTCVLTGIRDSVGNEAPATEWTWQLDFDRDTEGPPPPRLYSYNRTLLLFDDFSQGNPYWRPRSGGGATVAVSEAPDGNNAYLEIRRTTADGIFGAYASRTINPTSYSYMTFDYKLTPGIPVDLALRIGSDWYAVRMAGETTLPVIGEIPDVVADGQWHHAFLDLGKMMRAHWPDKEELETIKYVAIGTQQYHDVPEDATICLDNIAVFRAGPPVPDIYCTLSDPTGIDSYALGLTRTADGEANMEIDASRYSRLLTPALDEAGLWYIHVRARDGAGNWGETAHWPYICLTPLGGGQDGTEAETGWRPVRTTTGRNVVAYLQRATTVKDKNEVIVVNLRAEKSGGTRIGHTVRRPFSPGTTVTADLFFSGQRAIEVAAFARYGYRSDFESERIELPPNEWRRDVTFTLAADASAGAVPDAISEYGFVLLLSKSSRGQFIIDNVRVEQGPGSALSSSPSVP